MASVRHKTSRTPPALTALALALWLASCAAAPETGPAPPPDPVPAASASPAPATDLDTPLGDFLAARIALIQGDPAAAADYYAAVLRHDPDNADILQEAFGLALTRGQLDQAVPLAQRMVAIDVPAPLAHLVLGVAEVRQNHFKDAETQFAALPHRGMTSFIAPLLEAWAQTGAGETDTALETLKTLSANGQGLQSLQDFHAALINDVAGRTAAAAPLYEHTVASGMISVRTLEVAGSFFQRTGHPERAKDLYDRYRNEFPDSMVFDGDTLLRTGTTPPKPVADARDGLAEALFDVAQAVNQGKIQNYALMFARLALEVKPDFPLAQVLAGDILTNDGHLAEANALYLGISPDSPVRALGRMRADTNLDAMGQTEPAMQDLARLAKEHPATVDPLLALGDIQRQHQDFDGAIASYDEALRRLPAQAQNRWALLFSRAVAYERSHRWPQAEADLQAALTLNPNQPDILNYLGYSWVDRGVQIDRAIGLIERAIRLKPDDGAIVDSLGWAFYRLGKFQDSVQALEHAVELKPDDPTITEHLGDAYWRSGRQEEAREQWKRALTLNPEPDQIDGLRDKVRTGQLPSAPTPSVVR
jgi:tetratricopeptide (TPR) repeat protein